jgi:hypothetical protein
MHVAIRPEKDVMKAENRVIMPKAITRIASHVVPYFLRMRLEGISAAVYLWGSQKWKGFREQSASQRRRKWSTQR